MKAPNFGACRTVASASRGELCSERDRHAAGVGRRRRVGSTRRGSRRRRLGRRSAAGRRAPRDPRSGRAQDRARAACSGSHSRRSARSPDARIRPSATASSQVSAPVASAEPGLRIGLDDVRRGAAGVTRTLDGLHRTVRRDADLDRVARRDVGQLLEREPDRRPPGRHQRRVGTPGGERGAPVGGVGAAARRHGSILAARTPQRRDVSGGPRDGSSGWCRSSARGRRWPDVTATHDAGPRSTGTADAGAHDGRHRRPCAARCLLGAAGGACGSLRPPRRPPGRLIRREARCCPCSPPRSAAQAPAVSSRQTPSVPCGPGAAAHSPRWSTGSPSASTTPSSCRTPGRLRRTRAGRAASRRARARCSRSTRPRAASGSSGPGRRRRTRSSA